MIRILHITDFHIDNPKGDDEHLRIGGYKQYINSLVSCLASNGLKEMNAIIATGDFVHRNKHENFSHAEIVLAHLRQSFNLTNLQIGVCIGNHDYDYRSTNAMVTDSLKELIGNRDIDEYARKEYKQFEKEFSNGRPIQSTNRVSLSQLADNLYYLAMDSTLGSNGENQPGEILEQREIDKINEIVDSSVPNNNLLIIGCHYPVQRFSREVDYNTGKKKDKKPKANFWNSGVKLRERLTELSILHKQPTLWLFGDKHLADDISYDLQHFVMTGRIGMSTDADHTNIPRQIKVIEFSDIFSIPTIYHFVFENVQTHESDVNLGEWKLYKKYQIPIIEKGHTTLVREEKSKTEIELISTTIEDRIIEDVVKNKLYMLGRFNTSEDENSLGWIPINQLFKDANFLNLVLDKTYTWLNNKKVFDQELDLITFVGLDFWGAIIATHMTVLTGVRNICLSSRDPNTNVGMIDDNGTTVHIENELDKIKCLVFFTDVISSGKTLVNINKWLSENLKLNRSCKLLAISIIADKEQDREKNLDFLSDIGSHCLNIRLPILKSNQLPLENILPSNVDMRI